MITAMDTDGDKQISLDEFLQNISKCAGLCAALFENQVDGKLAGFRSLQKRADELENSIHWAKELNDPQGLSKEVKDQEAELVVLKKRMKAAKENLDKARAAKEAAAGE